MGDRHAADRRSRHHNVRIDILRLWAIGAIDLAKWGVCKSVSNFCTLEARSWLWCLHRGMQEDSCLHCLALLDMMHA